jgi:[protein-PII] uridylyltransferase
MLRQLYTETRRALRRGLQNPVGRKEVIDATRKAAAELLEYRGFLEEELDEFWETRGDDYFLRERPEDIAWHTEAIADHNDIDEPLVLVRQSVDSPIANATQIFVHAKNTPKLFARICAEIELMDLSINDARIYFGTDGGTLDTFFVLNADGSAIAQDEHVLEGIRLALQSALEAGKDRMVSRRTPRQLKSFVLPTETNFTQDLDRGWTIMEVATPDRPGLLARIGSVFVDHHVSLQAAKIQTLGERVEDVFFITDDDGNAITDQSRLNALSYAIAEALDAGLKASA